MDIVVIFVELMKGLFLREYFVKVFKVWILINLGFIL